MNLIDIILIILIAVIVVMGIKKGFIASVLEFAFSFLGTAVSWLVAANTCGAVYDKYFKAKLIEQLNDKFIPAVADKASSGINSILSAVPESILNLAEKIGITNIDELFLNASGIADVSALEKNFFGPVAVFAVKCILFICLSVVIGILFRLVTKLIAKAVKNSPVKGLNFLLGGLFGFCKATIIILVVSLVSVYVSYLAPQNSFSVAVSQSKICSLAVDILNLI